jgi:hypothetical protein
MRKAMWLAGTCALILLPGASIAGGRHDGNWTTNLSCEAHGETKGYRWEFPSTIKDGNFNGVHGEAGEGGYLLIEGKIAEDGSAKLSAKGKLTQNNAHGVFAVKGNNHSYTIKAQFADTKGTGTRNDGAGILGRPCTFEFTKQPDTAPDAAH